MPDVPRDAPRKNILMKRVSDINLKGRDRKAIDVAVHLLRKDFPVTRVVLYGSKAKGTDHEESDIDLLVLTSRDLCWQERDTITDTLSDVELAHDVVISTLVVPVHEWSAGRYAVLPIHDEVDRIGIAA